MNCDKCGSEMKNGEETEHHGQLLCEDCYMDALSPARTCDPWAVMPLNHFQMTKLFLPKFREKY